MSNKKDDIAITVGMEVETKLRYYRELYNKYVKDNDIEPMINEDTGEPEILMSYDEWLKKAIV